MRPSSGSSTSWTAWPRITTTLQTLQTSGIIYQSARRNIPEDLNLQHHHCGNRKCHVFDNLQICPEQEKATNKLFVQQNITVSLQKTRLRVSETKYSRTSIIRNVKYPNVNHPKRQISERQSSETSNIRTSIIRNVKYPNTHFLRSTFKQRKISDYFTQ